MPHPNLRVVCEYDSDTDSPIAEDYWWKLYSFSRKHNNCITDEEIKKLGIKLTSRDTPPIVPKKLAARFEKGTAFWLAYFEHGQCAWMLSNGPHPGGVEFQWDGVRYAGLLLLQAPAKEIKGLSLEERRKQAISTLEYYTKWCNGETKWITIQDADTSEDLESCGDVYDTEDFLREHARLLQAAEDISYGGDVDVSDDVKTILAEAPETATLQPC